MSIRKRILYLALGQILSALGVVAMCQANIGLEPWSCLHQGLSNLTGISFGTCSILVGAAAILGAALLKEPLGLGTLLNVLCPGILIDLFLAMGFLPLMDSLWGGILMMLVGELILALGTYFYMATAMGAGPRDALMVAMSRPLRLLPGVCRTALEVLAVALGWLLGAKVGVGTLLSAATMGLFIQKTFDLFHFDPKTLQQINFPQLWAALLARLGKTPPAEDAQTHETHETSGTPM